MLDSFICRVLFKLAYSQFSRKLLLEHGFKWTSYLIFIAKRQNRGVGVQRARRLLYPLGDKFKKSQNEYYTNGDGQLRVRQRVHAKIQKAN